MNTVIQDMLLGSIVEKLLEKILLSYQENGFLNSKNDKYSNKKQSGKKELNNLAYGHKKDSLGRFVNTNNFLSSNYTIWLGNRKGLVE